MRASAKVWLQEQRKRRNALPPEEEARIQRLKERLQLGAPLQPHEVQQIGRRSQPTPGTSLATASLPEQNAILLARLDNMEKLLRHGEEERIRLRTQLLQASDENRRCAMQLIHSALERHKEELLLEEQLFRERLLRLESETRQNILWEVNRRSRGRSCRRGPNNERVQIKTRLLSSQQFYT
ncbi:uncharacterized protein Tco025E_08578 [Trypanosoma conorhini]|uniref:Uncharacterized protein n=1 Tax=Trypanosoma conorhini TaxID=83891 RepID=A0A3R7KU66_9TRYP|nr:uncharacterized protein Tco025E_08578 [Trypanosoma conorhini]RNF01443.1 hypothetical protein Tco025E_08578 [Trypanosoma conorhini]